MIKFFKGKFDHTFYYNYFSFACAQRLNPHSLTYNTAAAGIAVTHTTIRLNSHLKFVIKCRLWGTVILSYRKARICGSLVKIKARNATPAPSTTAIPKSIPQTLHFVLESIIMRYILLEFDDCSVTQRCVSFVKRMGKIS